MNSLFPSATSSATTTGVGGGGAVDSAASQALLNTLVCRLSEEMVNDVPAQDPRWAEAAPRGKATGGQ